MFAKSDQLETAFDPSNVERFIDTYAKIPAGAHRDPARKLVGVVFDQPIYLHERYMSNKTELPGLLYSLVVPQLEERYRKQHSEVEPTDAEIDDLTAKTKAGYIQSAVEQRNSLELDLSRKRQSDPSSKDDPRTLAAIKEVDDMLKRLEANDGRSHAAESLRKFKLQKHIYENYDGGRALLGGGQGLVLIDAQKQWLDERERLGEFQIASNEFRKILESYWTIDSHPGSKLIEEAELLKIFDENHRGESSSTQRLPNREKGSATGVDNSPETITSTEVVIKESSTKFPFEKVAGHIASIKQRTAVAGAVEELRKITGLDFGNGIDRESRQAWLTWWEYESSCINNAKDGVRPFVLTGVITANGKPVSGTNVRANVPFKSSSTGQYQVGETLSDSSGRYVLALGIPPFAAAEESTWKATFTVRNPPRFVPDHEPVVMTLHRQKREGTDSALNQDTREKNNDTIFAGVPVEINVKLRPGTNSPLN
jgi:hypothetical protein